MSEPPSEPGSVHTSKSTSPHLPDDQRKYDSVIIAKIEDDPSFAVLPLDVVFDDGKNLATLFGFDPSKPLDSLKRSIRKFACLEGQDLEFSIFMRIEQDSDNSVISRYIRDFSSEIRKCKGRHRYSKYDELVNLNRDKISKRYYCVPRTKKTDPQVASSSATGVHGTRRANIQVESTTDSDAPKEKAPAMQPSSAHVLQVAAAKARKELSGKRASQIIDSDQDEADFQTQTKEPTSRQLQKKGGKGKASEANPSKGKAPQKGKKTPVKTPVKTPSKKAATDTTPARKSARQSQLKLTPLKISTVPSVRPNKPPPPKNPPRNKRAASPVSVSSGGTPAKNPRITEDFEKSDEEVCGTPQPDVAPQDQQSGQVDQAGASDISPSSAQPSSANAQLLATFVTTPTEQQLEQTMDQPTFRGTPGAMIQFTPTASAESSNAVTPVLGRGIMEDLKFLFDQREKAIKEFIVAENLKITRRQHKLYALMKEVKEENARLRSTVTELIASNTKIYEKVKLVGDQTAERKGTIATLILRFFPLDIGGEFADIFLGCNWVQKHLPPLIARQIELLKKTSVNKQIGNGVMHFLFSPYMISHFILGDTKKSLRLLNPINRPIPRGVTRVIIPSVIEVMKKRVTLESKDDKENVKLVRAGFSDLFGNSHSTFLNQIAEYCRNSNDFLRAAYMCDKIFFEANKHFFKPGTKFFTEEEHRALMMKRDNVKEMVEREECGLIKKEKKKKFISPQEAVMEMRLNVGLDQLSARQTIEYIIDAAREVGENYENLLFDKDCGVKNLDALYKTVLAEKKIAWAQEDQQARQRSSVSLPDAVNIEGFPPVFREETPKASSSGVRPSIRAIIQERKEEANFPDRKATTSSSNTDALVIDTAAEEEDSVFGSDKKKKKKKVLSKKAGKTKKSHAEKEVDEVSTSSEDEGDMSLDDNSSDEGLDDEVLAEQLGASMLEAENDDEESAVERPAEELPEHEAPSGNEEEQDGDEQDDQEEVSTVSETQQAEEEEPANEQRDEEQHEEEEQEPAAGVESGTAVNPTETTQTPDNPPVDDE